MIIFIALDEEERPSWFKPEDEDIGPEIQSSHIREGHWPLSLKVKGTLSFCEGPLCIRIADEALERLTQKKSKAGDAEASQPTMNDIRRTRARKECVCNHRRYCDHCMFWHALSAEGKSKVKEIMKGELKRQATKKLHDKIMKLEES